MADSHADKGFPANECEENADNKTTLIAKKFFTRGPLYYLCYSLIYMDFSLNSLLAGFIFGVLGIFLIKRGKEESNFTWAGVGLTLIVYPYFISNTFLIWALGAALLLLAYTQR